ncbi:hypothetical protein BLS_003134 [Venturia inaequalis]|nr:hypothetical protein BLS_003134 [Venturia inaequalis]
MAAKIGPPAFGATVSNPLVIYNSIMGIKQAKPGTLRWEKNAEIREILKPILGSLEEVVLGNYYNLTKGQQDLGGKYIWEHAASFREIESDDLLSQITTRFDNTLNGPMLDYMWRLDHVYITQSNVGSTRYYQSCKEDLSGPQNAKVCLDEYPSKVFYIQKYAKMKGNPVMMPMGWDRIEEIPGNFTLENIVRASVAHYTLKGLVDKNEFGDIEEYLEGRGTDTPNAFDNVKKMVDANNQYHGDEIIKRSAGPLNGLLHIPIARCDGAECISGGHYDDWHYEKSGEKITPTDGYEDKNYPCMVGAYDSWNSDGEPNTRVGYADEQFNFIKAVHLVNEKSLEQTCRKEQKCHPENTSRNPKFQFGEKVKYNEYSTARCKYFKRRGKKQEVWMRPRNLIDQEKKELEQLDAQVKQRYIDKIKESLIQEREDQRLWDLRLVIRRTDLWTLDEKESGIFNNGTAQPAFITLQDLPTTAPGHIDYSFSGI